MTVVVWSSSSVIPATSPTASSSWESWLFMLSTVTWVLPRSGTTCPATSFIVSSATEKILASRKNIHANTKNATVSATKSTPFASSTNTSNPTVPPTVFPAAQLTSIIQPSAPSPPHRDGAYRGTLCASAHHPAADHPIAFVEYRRLPGRDAHNRLRKMSTDLAARVLKLARHGWAVVAHLHRLGLLGGEEPVETPQIG